MELMDLETLIQLKEEQKEKEAQQKSDEVKDQDQEVNQEVKPEEIPVKLVENEDLETIGLEAEGVATIIDPDVISDEDPIVVPDHILPDLQYQKQRPILLFQLIFIYALVFLKYGT